MDENEIEEALQYITPVDTALLEPLLSENYKGYKQGLSERIGADGVLEDGDAFDPEREEVRRLRLDGMNITEIAEQTGMPEAQVTDYCHELGLPTEGNCHLYISVGSSSAKPQTPRCQNCGAPVPPGRKKFCCDRCHEEFKYEDRKSMGGKTAVCKYCGVVFNQWKSKDRKYCSRECYLADRYGWEIEEGDDEE